MTHAEIVDYTVPFSWSIEKKELMNGWLNLKAPKCIHTFQKILDDTYPKPKFWLWSKRHNNTTLNPLIM
jgi:hypothetical protein